MVTQLMKNPQWMGLISIQERNILSEGSSSIWSLPEVSLNNYRSFSGHWLRMKLWLSLRTFQRDLMKQSSLQAVAIMHSWECFWRNRRKHLRVHRKSYYDIPWWYALPSNYNSREKLNIVEAFTECTNYRMVFHPSVRSSVRTLLEKYFCWYRGNGGRQTNPTIKEFM